MLNFRGTRGLLVKYSAHYRRNHPTQKGVAKFIGIVTDTQVFQENGVLVTYPIVMWEGGVMASLTHPMNVVPYRRGTKLPELP